MGYYYRNRWIAITAYLLLPTSGGPWSLLSSSVTEMTTDAQTSRRRAVYHWFRSKIDRAMGEYTGPGPYSIPSRTMLCVSLQIVKSATHLNNTTIRLMIWASFFPHFYLIPPLGVLYSLKCSVKYPLTTCRPRSTETADETADNHGASLHMVVSRAARQASLICCLSCLHAPLCSRAVACQHAPVRIYMYVGGKGCVGIKEAEWKNLLEKRMGHVFQEKCW